MVNESLPRSRDLRARKFRKIESCRVWSPHNREMGMSISSIGIQTVTANTGTGSRQQQAAPQQQQGPANDNSDASAALKSGSSSQTTGKHVDKMV
jgi:hypothetical protein